MWQCAQHLPITERKWMQKLLCCNQGFSLTRLFCLWHWHSVAREKSFVVLFFASSKWIKSLQFNTFRLMCSVARWHFGIATKLTLAHTHTQSVTFDGNGYSPLAPSETCMNTPLILTSHSVVVCLSLKMPFHARILSVAFDACLPVAASSHCVLVVWPFADTFYCGICAPEANGV